MNYYPSERIETGVALPETVLPSKTIPKKPRWNALERTGFPHSCSAPSGNGAFRGTRR